MNDAKPTWINRPAAKAHEVPYEPPEKPSNPVIRGIALYYGAQL